LDTLLTELGMNSPGHPLIALFQPLVEKNTELLRQNAAKYYNQIETFQSDAHPKSKLHEVFVDWLIQRFTDMGKTEVEQMLLGKLPDIRETQTGKDLIAIGVEEGIVKGIEKGKEIGKIQILEQILGLPETESLDTFLIEDLKSRLDHLQQQIQLRNKGS